MIKKILGGLIAGAFALTVFSSGAFACGGSEDGVKTEIAKDDKAKAKDQDKGKDDSNKTADKSKDTKKQTDKNKKKADKDKRPS